MSNNYYVYAYLRYTDSITARIGMPYYIGKGTGNRAYVKHHNRIPKYKEQIAILKFGLTHQESVKLEKFLIAYYGRKDLGTGILCNLTDGGEGIINPSLITREKMAKAKRNESPETRLKRSIAAKARGGRRCSAETKSKIGKANTGKKRTEETKKILSELKIGKTSPKKGKKIPEEHLQNVRAANILTGLKRRGKKQKRLTCPHCNKIGGESGMKRYHFDNCKLKE